MFSLLEDETLLFRCGANHKKVGGTLITTSNRIVWLANDNSAEENITIGWENVNRHQYPPNTSKKAAIRIILHNKPEPISFIIQGGQVKDAKTNQIELRRIISDFIESNPSLNRRSMPSVPNNSSESDMESFRKAELEADSDLYQLYK